VVQRSGCQRVRARPTPAVAYGRERYDAFGRQLETYNLDGSISLRTAYLLPAELPS
jgi:hypothetical protein